MHDWIRDEPNIDDKWCLMFWVFSLHGMGPMSFPIDSGWRWLQLEVRQLQPQLMVNVKLQCSWSVVREGCAPHCGSLRMLVHPAPQSRESWGSPAGAPGGTSAKLIANSTEPPQPPVQAAFGGQQLWTRSSCNVMRGPMWELHAWARPKSWPTRLSGKVAKGGSYLHTATVMHYVPSNGFATRSTGRALLDLRWVQRPGEGAGASNSQMSFKGSYE